MSETTHDVNELIEVLNDSREFYDQVAESAKDPAFQSLFRRMAKNKMEIVTDLSGEVRARGDQPANAGTFFGTTRQTYADLRAKISDQPDVRYVEQLEESEDRIVKAFRNAARDDDKPAVQAIAQKHLPEVDRMHQEMRELKHRLQRR